jgi:hypothetical protein
LNYHPSPREPKPGLPPSLGRQPFEHMPSYGSIHSPSLRKMEYSRAQYGRKRMSLGNIIGDPFALATLSIATVSFE